MIPRLRGVALVCAVLAASAGAGAAQRGCTPTAAAAPWPAPLDRPVSLQARELSLRDALDRLSASARITLSYSPDLLPLDRRVCLRASRARLGDALRALVGPSGMEPSVVAGQVVLVPAARPALAAPTLVDRVSVLDALVVTGSPTGARRRDLTVAMDAVTGDQLVRRSAGSLPDVLNSAAPGAWAWRQAPSALLARYAGVRGASSFDATYPKVYVDGVEIANPLLLATLDAESIERVEVIRGPQGAALYGSDAISGVINITTRQGGTTSGRARPELVSRAGATASSFAAAPLPTHEERLALRTGSNLASASLAVTLGGSGAIYPEAGSRSLGASGAGRWVLPGGILSVTARVLDRHAGVGRNPLLEDSAARGLDTLRQGVTHYTVSAGATLGGRGGWTHNVLVGVDGYQLDYLEDTLFPTAADSALLTRGTGTRATVRGASTLRMDGAGGRVSGSLTLAAELGALRQFTARGSLLQPATWRNDTGLLAQASGSLDETWFLTGGMRLERNDALGNHAATLLPMLGGAWVRDLGESQLKLRAAYGRGIRAAQTPARSHLHARGSQVAAELEPEAQSGIELGAELYVSDLLSVSVTRFDQRASGLIQDVVIGFENGSGGARRPIYQLQNVGAIDNRGWEAQASLTHGALSVTAGVAQVNSRVAGLSAGYNGELRPGDRMLGVPARTATLGAQWRSADWSATLGVERAWDWIGYDRRALAAAITSSSVPAGGLYGAGLREYWREYAGSTELRGTLWRRVRPGVWLTAAGENLLNHQLGEPDNAAIRAGRTLTLGVRASL